MKTFKPEMNLELAVTHLKHIEGEQVSSVTPIEMGELSKVFSYRKENADYVIHFKNNRDSLDKERMIYNRFGAHGLPVPQVYKIGALENIHYSTKDKMPGTPISALAPGQIRHLLPSIIEQFMGMIQIHIDDSNKGIGWISPEGAADHRTWVDCLSSFFDEEQEGFHHGWQSLFESSFLEREFFEDIYQRMIGLASYSPSERYLVHGDFHLGNMLGDDQRVTGIVDWEMAMYGDFMFDVSVLDLWYPMLEFPKKVQLAMQQQGMGIPHFEERLLCCQLFKALDGLRFYSKKDDPASYEFMKNRIQSLLHP